jgi:DNA-directed RNA polymerase subunit RPC12/RpoP
MKKMGRYKCAKCNESFDELPSVTVRCPNCANKILLKVRQPVKKTIKAR